MKYKLAFIMNKIDNTSEEMIKIYTSIIFKDVLIFKNLAWRDVNRNYYI